MNIFSFSYFIFVLILLAVYYGLPFKLKKFQWVVLLAANIVFYAISGIANFAFIILTSLTTFYGAKIVFSFNSKLKEKKALLSKEDFKIEKQKNQNKKRLVLVSMLSVNIGILLYLKYYLVLFTNKTLLLPLGISYYTLQAISYFMDIYNSKYEAENNFFKYFGFISFFPQLMMGPFNRYNDLGKQLEGVHPFDFENIKQGVLLFLFGALKKFLIADMLFGQLSAVLDSSVTTYPGCIILFSILMYAFYQYADFSGGIDMVLGVAKLFGLNMQKNFRQPYFATSLGDFWRRWHISLGMWMKDYIFYPFALTKIMQNTGKWFTNHIGKHAGRTIPACIANILVFMLVGVWHGPELHFFVWGLYNGLIIAFSDLFKPFFEKLSTILHLNVKTKSFHIFRILRTFIIVNIGWYFDKIVDVKRSFILLKNTFTDFGNPAILTSKEIFKAYFVKTSDFWSQMICVAIGLIIVIVVSFMKENNINVYEKIQKKNIVFRWAVYYILLILIILSLSFSSGDTGFMYAQY